MQHKLICRWLLYHFKLFSLWPVTCWLNLYIQATDMWHGTFSPISAKGQSSPCLAPLDTTPHHLEGGHSWRDLGQVTNFSYRQGACDTWLLNNLKWYCSISFNFVSHASHSSFKLMKCHACPCHIELVTNLEMSHLKKSQKFSSKY